MSFCVAAVALCDIPTCLIHKVSKMSKLEEVSHEMLVFLRPRVSSRVSAIVFLWRRRVYEGSCKTNLSFSKVSKQVVMSFCVAAVALCDIPTCLIHKVSKMSKLEEVSHEMLVFLRPRVSSRVSAMVFLWRRRVYEGSSALHTLHFTLHTAHSTIYTLDSSLHTLHTLHSPLHTLHATLLTLHSTHYTLHSTLYTFHSTLQTGNRGNMHKTVQINYCRKVFCVAAYPCVSTSVPLTYVWAFGLVGCILFFFISLHRLHHGQDPLCTSAWNTLLLGRKLWLLLSPDTPKRATQPHKSGAFPAK